MKLYLESKGLWEGAIENPPTPSTPESKKASNQARSLIGLSVGDDYLDIVFDSDTASQGWEKLKNIFEPNIAGRAIKLQRDLAELRMETSESLEGYMACSRALHTNLRNADVPTSEHQLVTAALAGLPARFDDVVKIYQRSKL